MSLIYLDASALVKLIRPEKESLALKAFLESQQSTHSPQLASSLVARAETLRAINRGDPSLLSKTHLVLQHVTFLAVTTRIIDQVGLVSPPTLRTLDAIHLVTAREEVRGVRAFIAYDQRLLEAASRAGLPIVAPGL